MLDIAGANSLPPAIVVGRTLSAYDVPDVKNNTETITLTVYNQQANSITGVLLTDTLASGVTFAAGSNTASQLPDQSGQNLAWSLGTIQGFDRTNVTLTVSLASPTPLTLDTGAAAFGTLDAGMVSWTTAPATLRSTVIAANLLASTPDANTADPFVQEKAAELNYDPTRIFNFLQTDIGYNSYTGSLRGARGTLWSSAGNSLDDASLGVALMRASGIPAQYEEGTLDTAQTQQLILSMFPASYQTVGYIPAGTTTSDPANDPQLLAETKDHFWFQFDSGSGMKDADPEFVDQGIGQTAATSTNSFTEVADNLRAKTEIKLTAELYYPFFAGLIGALNELNGGAGVPGTSQSVVLDQTFNDVDLVGHPLTIGNFVTQTPVQTIFSPVTNTYSPYLEVGDEAFPDSSHDQIIRGQDYQEILSGYPIANQILTGLFLSVNLSGPDTSSVTIDKTLVDRIGYAAREGNESPGLKIDPTTPPLLSETDAFTLSILAGSQPLGPLVALASQLSQLQSTLAQVATTSGATDPQTIPELSSFYTDLTRGEVLGFENISDHFNENNATIAGVKAFFVTPRVTFASAQEAGDGLGIDLTMDVLREQLRVITTAGQNVS